MGKIRFRIVWMAVLSLFVFSMPQLCAQQTWKEWLGVQVGVSMCDIGVNLKPTDLFPKGKVVSPQIGYKAQLGLVLDKQSKTPIVLAVEYSQANNKGKETLEVLKSTSILDIGIESPSWILLDKSRHQLRFDMAAFASRCSISTIEMGGFHKWGISGRTAFVYEYEFSNNLNVGCKFYYQIGRYFGKESAFPMNFSFVDGLGVGMVMSF